MTGFMRHLKFAAGYGSQITGNPGVTFRFLDDRGIAISFRKLLPFCCLSKVTNDRRFLSHRLRVELSLPSGDNFRRNTRARENRLSQ